MTFARTRLAALIIAAAAVASVFAAGGDATAAAAAPSPTAAPVISGTVQQGQTLQTTSGSWAGTTPMTFTYQWQRCGSGGNNCSFISGETSSTYTLAAADVGHTMRSVVTAHNSAGTGTSSSNHTDFVTSAAAPTNTSLPTISGTPAVGGTLTASNGSWSGTSPINYAYDWRRCDASGDNCASISGANKTTYTLVNGDEGHTLRVSITATNSAGQATAGSAATAVVTAGAPANTVAPVVSGTTTQDQVLTTSNGIWTGTQPIAFTYAWQLCDAAGNNCAAVSGANNQTFQLTAADVGHKVRSSVTGTNSAGSNHVESSTVGPIASSSTLPPGAVKLPDGEISVPASSVPDSDHLTIISVKYANGGVHGRSPATATVKVIDDNKYVISGALVYLLPAPRNFATHPAEQPTAQNGTVAIPFTLTPAAPHKGTLLLFIRARTPQGDLLAGSSTRRLVQMRIFPS